VAYDCHKRDTDARRFSRIPRSALVAAPLATLATVTAVTAGVVSSTPSVPGGDADMLARAPLSASVSGAPTERRMDTVSRASARDEVDTTALDSAAKLDRFQDRLQRRADARATRRAVDGADTHRWATTDLNLWNLPGKNGEKTGLLEEGTKVLVTGRRSHGRVELAVQGRSRWVSAGYLADSKPKPPQKKKQKAASSSGSSSSSSSSSGGSSGGGGASLGGACTNGSSVSGGANVLKVHEAVCAAFPSITSYGTYRGDGEHAQGLAIDIMVSGGTGWQVAEFVRSHYRELGVSYVIYSQKIWSVQRSGEGWRGMSDRGSATANHYDHVHVTTY
jgi:uncharacterized membrane protein YgcG